MLMMLNAQHTRKQQQQTILNKTSGGNTPKADVERAMQAVTQANTALNGIQNLERKTGC